MRSQAMLSMHAPSAVLEACAVFSNWQEGMCVCVSTYPGSGQEFLYMLHCPITRFRPALQVVPGIPPCLSLPASCMVGTGTQLRVVGTGWLQLVKRESTPTRDIRTYTPSEELSATTLTLHVDAHCSVGSMRETKTSEQGVAAVN